MTKPTLHSVESATDVIDKKKALEDCIDAVKVEATNMDTTGKSAIEIEFTVKSMARAILISTKLFTAPEIDIVVNSLKIGKNE